MAVTFHYPVWNIPVIIIMMDVSTWVFSNLRILLNSVQCIYFELNIIYENIRNVIM